MDGCGRIGIKEGSRGRRRGAGDRCEGGGGGGGASIVNGGKESAFLFYCKSFKRWESCAASPCGARESRWVHLGIDEPPEPYSQATATTARI
jgi:hypothetical protein